MSDSAVLAVSPAGSPILSAALGAVFMLESLDAEDAGHLETAHRLISEWFTPKLRWSLNSTVGIVEPFRVEDLGFASAYPSLLAERRSNAESAEQRDLENRFLEAEYGGLAVACHGGREPHHANPYSYRFYSEFSERGQLRSDAILQLTVPFDWPLDDFAARIDALVSVLRLRWASAGLTYAEWEMHWGVAGRRALYAHARRYHGYDVSIFATLLRQFRASLRSINWLTYVGDSLRSKLVGDSTPPPGIVTSELGGKLRVQAGATPQAGDVNRLEVPDAYVAADQYLRRIRATTGVNFYEPWDESSTEAWLRRFENS